MKSYSSDLPNADKIEELFKEVEANLIKEIKHEQNCQIVERDAKQQQIIENLLIIRRSLVEAITQNDKTHKKLKWVIGWVIALNIVSIGWITVLSYFSQELLKLVQ